MKQRIFVDMDGTLTEYRPFATYEDYLQRHFFETLQPQSSIVEAVRKLVHDPRFEIYTLSAVFSEKENPYSVPEKNGWLDRFLPEIDNVHRIYCPCGEDKEKYVPGGVRANDVLLDDYSKNLHAWSGIGIKCINGVNATKGTWQRDRIFVGDPAEAIAEQIREYAQADRKPSLDSMILGAASERAEYETIGEQIDKNDFER